MKLRYPKAAFIWNLRRCAYGSSTSSLFNCAPPNWAKYLGIAPIGDEIGIEGGSEACAKSASGEGGGGAGELGGGGGDPAVGGVGGGDGAEWQKAPFLHSGTVRGVPSIWGCPVVEVWVHLRL